MLTLRPAALAPFSSLSVRGLGSLGRVGLPWRPAVAAGRNSQWPKHEAYSVLYPVEMSREFDWVLGLHMMILGGKRHVSLFPPHVLHMVLCFRVKCPDISAG